MNQVVEANETNVATDTGAVAKLSGDSAIQDPGAYLAQLIDRRSTWEYSAYRASNDVLYRILGDCLRLYYYVSTPGDDGAKARAKLRDQIIKIAKDRELRFVKDTHLATKIVRCVFDTDRKRASTYSIVIRAAIGKEINPDNMSEFIRAGGGIEYIRLNKSGDNSKAKQAKDVLRSKLAGTRIVGEIVGINPDLIGLSAKQGDLNVAIVEWQDNGKFVVKWIGQSDAAVNSALVAFNRSQKHSKGVVQNDSYLLNPKPANDQLAFNHAA